MTSLSIIICTRNRAYAIVGCLDSVVAALQHANVPRAEIIVVDNGSTDDTYATVEQWAKAAAFPVKLVVEPKAGLSHARNCGLGLATGDLLVFTDDDCRPDAEYFSDLLRHDAQDTEAVLRGGRVELGDISDLPLSIKTTRERQRRSLKDQSSRRENVGDTVIGCNMTMRRETAQKIGAFDTLLGAGSAIAGGEDTDYLFRAYLCGVAVEYVPDMVIYHFHGRKKVEEGYKLLCGYALSYGALMAKYAPKHIDFCRPFYWDMKKALKDMVCGQNNYLPMIGFSHATWVRYSLMGAWKYLRVILKNKGVRP